MSMLPAGIRANCPSGPAGLPDGSGLPYHGAGTRRGEETTMRPLDLKYNLLLRISLFAVGLFAVAAVVAVDQAGQRIRADIQRTGSTIGQLISNQIALSVTAFDRTTLHNVDLSSLAPIGELIPFCAEVMNVYNLHVVKRCFGDAEATRHPLRKLIAWAAGPDAVYRGTIGSFPGIKVGELSVTPDYDRESAALARQLRNLLAITAGVLFLNVLIYVPVRRALQPTEAILDGLGRMEAGDLSVRLPDFPLIELQRISRVFNHLADRLQRTIEEQRELASRLLGVREEERRHLARELHDEFGQCLTSIQAEAAYAGEFARDSLPALLPCTSAIARTTAHMMEVLQQMLRQLRPIGLEEFGLVASLENLVDGWNRRGDGQCRYRLRIAGDLDGLSDTLNVNLYRIAQESLTNAARHGKAAEVAVDLARSRDGERIRLCIENDGAAAPAAPGGSGLGLLGMRERVLALGGHIDVSPRPAGGLRVLVELPAAPEKAKP